MDLNELQSKMRLPQFPLSAKYDIGWLCENEMGPSSTWLAEFLLEALQLQPGMKVLDLGCGKAMSSVFLAKECGTQVWATDLWINPSDNMKRIEAQGMADKVFPIHSEAHSLPFAHGFFDAIVSLDAYHYFGTDELYLSYITAFLKPKGRIGIVVPGVAKEFAEEEACRLGKLWEPHIHTFHKADWWKNLWHRSRLVTVDTADMMPDGHAVWLHWDKTLKDAGVLKRSGDVEMLETDGGNLTFVRIVGTRI